MDAIGQESNMLLVENKTVYFDDTFSLNITCVPIQLIYAWEFCIGFNSSILQPISVNKGNFFGNKDIFINYGNISQNKIINLYALLVPTSQGGIINEGSCMNITFKAISVGTSLVYLYNAGITNTTGYIPLTISSGSVIVTLNSIINDSTDIIDNTTNDKNETNETPNNGGGGGIKVEKKDNTSNNRRVKPPIYIPNDDSHSNKGIPGFEILIFFIGVMLVLINRKFR